VILSVLWLKHCSKARKIKVTSHIAEAIRLGQIKFLVIMTALPAERAPSAAGASRPWYSIRL
jgi:hypothetical protein